MSKKRLLSTLVVFLIAVGALWGSIIALRLGPQLGLDLQGGVAITLIPAAGQQVDTEILDQTVAIIRQRVDGLGVAEPEITRQEDTIQVQLPGLADQRQAEQVIGRTALLQFRPVLQLIPAGTDGYEDAGAPCEALQEGAPDPVNDVVICGPPEGVTDPADPTADPADVPRELWTKYRLGPVALGGDQVDNAVATTDQSGLTWQVQLDLSGEGGDAFAKVTGELACQPQGSPGRQLAIVLDGVVESAPQMSGSVLCDQGIPDGRAVITTGGGGQASAEELALVLRTGALPIQLEFGTSQSVSPTLGRSSLDAGLLAGGIGLVLVAVYMIFLYRGIGLAAVVELAMFGVIVYGLIIVLGATVGFTLTLAGIAGIIVSIGIAADSSIIYRERYRDELRAGRTIRTAADHAFTKAFRTNLTGNTVSLLAAAVLYVLAVGPVRGFAFTLGLSTVVDTLLFATFTRSLFGLIARNPRLARSKLVGLRAGVVEKAPELTGSARR